MLLPNNSPRCSLVIVYWCSSQQSMVWLGLAGGVNRWISRNSSLFSVCLLPHCESSAGVGEGTNKDLFAFTEIVREQLNLLRDALRSQRIAGEERSVWETKGQWHKFNPGLRWVREESSRKLSSLCPSQLLPIKCSISGFTLDSMFIRLEIGER